ncbi:thermonuclease family protein [Candidatus Roizmanbacteria bacterium]|nr:thermonuclease family protein [Candidatus Roizmanbacteria bacterium]
MKKRSQSLSSFSQIPLASPISLILVFVISILSFLGGSLYQSQKSQTTSNQETQISEKLIVSRVVDGDTVQLKNGKEVRLYGISTPEKKESYYSEAKQFTESLVLNKEITLVQEEKYKQDKFGRLLGYVFVDGVNLNIELVRNGLAKVVLYEKRAKIKYQDELLAAENNAKSQQLAIWSR